jgi:predicted NUDIX family phosphoesterase
MSTEEHILVVPAVALDTLGRFEGFRPDDGTYVQALLAHADLSFQPRGAMEQDPSFKQLIPYVLLECQIDSQPHLFCYTRGSGQGEARLHAKRSVGIGGHISREDADKSDPYRTGMQRELEEEVVMSNPNTEELVGLIYDPSTDVGQVHLGIVHRLRFEGPTVHARETDLVDAGFQPIAKLLTEIERFETWSQLCLKSLYNV